MNTSKIAVMNIPQSKQAMCQSLLTAVGECFVLTLVG